MPQIPLEETTRQLVAVLHEAVEGPPESWSYFRLTTRLRMV
jgi:hypothetical protein